VPDNIVELRRLARRVAGKDVPIELGANPSATDGTTIFVSEPSLRWPKLSARAHGDMRRKSTAHEAAHIRRFRGASAEEFFCSYADPFSPGADSLGYVRRLLNIVEDELVDRDAGREIGQEAVDRVNRFYVWNRQGGARPSLAELEASGKGGKCAAFIEALYQLALYGEIIESYHSEQLEKAAREASDVRSKYGSGSFSREQAMRGVLDALRRYCPPPWALPEEYQPPQENSGGAGGQSGQSQGQPGNGQGTGQGQSGQGQSQGAGNGNPAQGQGSGQGQPGQGSPSQSGNAQGQGAPQPGQQSQAGQPSNPQGGQGNGQRGESPESVPESSGGGGGEGGEGRGFETGGEAGEAKPVDRAAERRFEDNNLEALLKTLERIIAERTKESGRGMPRWRQWSPGDALTSPDELQRYGEDEVFGIDQLQRRCVRQRDRKRHLLAVFIDSSGSVGNQLFSQLYRVCGELAEKVSALEGCFLGVGQFSGGASWVLEPTRDVSTIRLFAEEEPKRLYSGGTTVGEIYKILPEWFAGYKSADLVVLTDGYVENGHQLAMSLGEAHDETSCEIKLHGVVFKGDGSLKQFKVAKEELPKFVRTWKLGED
jgi:hypothetical protein